jgi:hypothetical protein
MGGLLLLMTGDNQLPVWHIVMPFKVDGVHTIAIGRKETKYEFYSYKIDSVFVE